MFARTLAYRPTLHWLKKALRGDRSQQPISILDIGSGGGGMMRKIWKWARRRGRETHLTGVVVNPRTGRAARIATEALGIARMKRASTCVSSLPTAAKTGPS
jgi:hypothetical protein